MIRRAPFLFSHSKSNGGIRILAGAHKTRACFAMYDHLLTTSRRFIASSSLSNKTFGCLSSNNRNKSNFIALRQCLMEKRNYNYLLDSRQKQQQQQRSQQYQQMRRFPQRQQEQRQGGVNSVFFTNIKETTTTSTAISYIRRNFHCTQIRHNSNKESNLILKKRGDHPYGSREYWLFSSSSSNLHQENKDDEIPSPRQEQEQQLQQQKDGQKEYIKVASIFAHRNIIFGAKLYKDSNSSDAGSGVGHDGEHSDKERNEINNAGSAVSLSQICLPLLDAALSDASGNGEQPQAVAALHGLCDWVTTCLKKDNEDYANENGKISSSSSSSEEIFKLRKENDLVSLEAIEAIATGIPRKGHSVVGIGTFNDGKNAWEALAKEYISLGLADEVNLYSERAGVVIAIEHLADKNPKYLKSAGGAMARIFFV